MTLSLVAPTTGATVGVRQIAVLGTVSPATAIVHVAGESTKVSGGNFNQTLQLNSPTTSIQITAEAPGYAPATVETSVHFNPHLAVALVAAHRAAWTLAPPTVPATRASRSTGLRKSAVPDSTLLSAGASPEVAQVVGETSHSNAGGSSSGSGSSSSGGGGTGGSSGSSAPTSSSGTPYSPAPSSDPAPTSNPQLPPAALIREAYLDGCRKAGGGQSAASYCTCMYDHVLAAGALSNRASIDAMEQAIEQFEKDQDLSTLPAYLRAAQISCVSKLPAPKLPVAGLKPLHHSAAPAPAPEPAPTTPTG